MAGVRTVLPSGGVIDSEGPHGSLLGSDNILYLDLGGGFMGV